MEIWQGSRVPREMEFAKDKEKFNHELLGVRLAIDQVLSSVISRDVISQHAKLADLSILRAPHGTNFPLTEAQAKILLELAKSDARTPIAQPQFTIANFSEESGFAQDVIDNHQFKIVSPNLVGQVPIGKECLITIAPKVPISNLFLMLEVAYNLKSFQLLPGIVQLNSLQDIIERLASILAKRVNDRARKGLYRDYLNEHDDMPFVRGRIDIQRTSRSMMAGAPTVHCHFQDHTADLVENQILLWTLQGISRLRITRAEVASQVRQARRTLSGVISLRHCTASECVNRFYHRLNTDYRPLHGICRFFLEHLGPGIDRGKYEAIPFCVDMPKLFETFVAEWLKANVPVNLLVDAQYSARLDANYELSFCIDIVLKEKETNRVICILDTKYKVADTPEISDIEQVGFYAGEMDTNKAFLVYPTSRIRRLQATVGKFRHVNVRSLSFDLSASLKQEVQGSSGKYWKDYNNKLPPEARFTQHVVRSL